MNLLSNACKFTSDGEINVKAWVCSIDETRKIVVKENAKNDGKKPENSNI